MHRRSAVIAGALLCALSAGCAVDTIESDEAEARMHYEYDQRANAKRVAESKARAAAAQAQEAARAAALAEQQRAAFAARREEIKRALAAQPEPDDIPALFKLGYSTGCKEATAVPLTSGQWVTYDDCMALFQPSDLDLPAEEAQGFGRFMALQSMLETYGE
jgi:hypothetical protein